MMDNPRWRRTVLPLLVGGNRDQKVSELWPMTPEAIIAATHSVRWARTDAFGDHRSDTCPTLTPPYPSGTCPRSAGVGQAGSTRCRAPSRAVCSPLAAFCAMPAARSCGACWRRSTAAPPDLFGTRLVPGNSEPGAYGPVLGGTNYADNRPLTCPSAHEAARRGMTRMGLLIRRFRVQIPRGALDGVMRLFRFPRGEPAHLTTIEGRLRRSGAGVRVRTSNKGRSR